MPRRLSPVIALTTLVLVACGREAPGTDADIGGTAIVALKTEPASILPPLIRQVDEKMVADQIYEPLAWLGDDGFVDRGFRPALADSWAWEGDSTVAAFHLNPGARWQDGTPVRASDVRFTFALYTDAAVGSLERQPLKRIDSVTVRDSLTPVFWFHGRYPDQLFDAAARMLIVPEHLLAAAPRETLRSAVQPEKAIGSGRFRLARWDGQQAIELVADTAHYRGRAKLDRVIFARTLDPNTLVPQMAGGEIDAAEIVSSDQFRALVRNDNFRTRVLPAFDYAFLQFNLRDPRRPDRPHPLFGDPALRRALSMAVDRARLVQSQFDTLASVSVGPMTHAQTLADTTLAAIPYDSAGAARMLDSLGWRLAPGKAIRERNGQPLAFSVLVPTVSQNRVAMVVRLQEALRTMGVDLKTDAVDVPAFMSRLTTRKFDAVFNGTHAEVSLAGLRSYWSVEGSRAADGTNFGSYENPAFDAQLDSALSAHSTTDARDHARQAFETIIADAPAIWIYEMRSAPVIHRRFRTVHVNPGAWWAGLGDWSIPASERLPRDRVGLPVPAR